MSILKIFILTVIWLSITSCETPKPELSSRLKFSEHQSIVFLDSLAASQHIIVDKKEHFFDKVRRLDMAIQMKYSWSSAIDTPELMDNYKDFLQQEVLDFSPVEKKFIARVMQKVFEHCMALSPALFPDEIKLIKTRGHQYGPLMYYTRGNCIVIPKQELAKQNEEDFLNRLLHEIFHIVSRYHLEIKHQLYQLIGFQALKVPISHIPIELDKRILLNPNVINFSYAMDVTVQGRLIKIIPITRSKYPKPNAAISTYFRHLQFSLYEIQKKQNDWEILCQENGQSTLNFSDLKDFLNQIGTNTGYASHPDEIMAANFVFLLKRKMNTSSVHFLSAKGRQLLDEMEEVFLNL